MPRHPCSVTLLSCALPLLRRYNEVSFYALNVIHPVTHALGNTLKRVVMIVVSVVVLNHRFTPLGLVGCCTAIGGVLAYSVSKAKYQSQANINEASSSSSSSCTPSATDAAPAAPAMAAATEPEGDQKTASDAGNTGGDIASLAGG